MDDILDVTGTQEKLGKAVQKDQAHGKLTYPGVFGLEAAREQAQKLIRDACKAIAHLKANENLIQLANFIVSRDY
jgi:geranylgeranyl diphosphate synthase type II